MTNQVIAAIMLPPMLATAAMAADPTYCKLYSREMLRQFVRDLPADSLQDLSVDGLSFQLTKYWTLCLNRDEPPRIDLPSDGQWIANFWSSIQALAGRPAPAGSAEARPPSPVVTPRAAAVVKKKPAATATGDPQPLCSSHGMRTVYNGLSWQCLR